MTKINFRTSRRGIASIWVAMTGFVLVALFALAMDTGYVVLGRQELQHAADAAALAAAANLRVTVSVARDAATDIASANQVRKTSVALDRNNANNAGGEIVVGIYDPNTDIFEPNDAKANAVQVTAKRTTASGHGALPLVFGSAFGVSTIDLQREATAMVDWKGPGILVLNPTKACALDVGGDTILQVTDNTAGPPPVVSTIQVNSNNSTAAACCSNGTIINVTEVDTVGGLDLPCYGGTTDTGVRPIPDPLAGLPDPPLTGDLGVINSSGNYGPGYYSGGIKMNGSNLVVNLSSGVYVLGGDGLTVNGGTLNADTGVMFYLKSGSSKTAVQIAGGVTLNITPMNSGTYAGISIFQARDNFNDAQITGGGGLHLTGTIYFPKNLVRVSGGSVSLGTQMIADSVSLQGNGTITINYDGRYGVPGSKPFLIK